MKTKSNIIYTVLIVACLVSALCIELFFPSVFYQSNRNYFVKSSLFHLLGSIGVILLLIKEKSKLFNLPIKLLWILPALFIAVDNFQFASYFNGNMSFASFITPLDVIAFAVCCLLTGLFEEVVFRGALFSVIARLLKKGKGSIIKTVVITSLIFGVMHIFNIFSGDVAGTFIQVGYSTLTGALFAFTLIKTQNLLTCAFTHALFNFCGNLFSAERGLGNGVVFDLPTIITMAVVSLFIAVVVIVSTIKYSQNECESLYAKLGFEKE